MGPRAGLDRCGKSRPHQDSIPVPSIQSVIQGIFNSSIGSMKSALANQGSAENFGDYRRISELKTSTF